MHNILNSQNIILVAGLHGNERAPVRAFSENNISFILGNPIAYESNARFTEQDLNASFGVSNKTYESRRAAEILEEIAADKMVIDFHTTAADTPPFAIVVDNGMISLAEMTGLEHVVVMKFNIKNGHALINYRDGISVEAGRHDDPGSYQTALRVAENIKSGKKFPLKVYEVYGKIEEPGEYSNFSEHPDGFVPVLAGETSYDFYGLKAKRIR